MNICPSSALNFLGRLKEIALITFGAVGSYVALKGLSVWKEERVWSHRSELKRNVLIELYKLEDAIDYLRRPKMTTTFIDRESDENRDTQLFKSFAKRYDDEWMKVLNHHNTLRAYLPEVRATWGKRLLDELDKLEPILQSLQWAVQNQVEARNPNTEEAIKADLHKEMNERSKIIFSRKDNDTFKKGITEVIEVVANYLETAKP